MKIIKSGEIEWWASRDDAINTFPALIRNLILFSEHVELEGFHAYNQNNRPGIDGKTTIENSQCRWIPSGVAYWELGNVKNPRKKADSDYFKRTEEVPEELRRGITFVFATPKNWIEGGNWADSKRELKQWKDVKVIDVESLEQWIEGLNYPSLVRIADIMELSVDGVELLKTSWLRWSKATTPTLPKSLFKRDIDRARNNYSWNRWKEGVGSRVIELYADTKDEALAFLYCLFKSDAFNQFDSSAAVVENKDKLLRLLGEENNTVILVNEDLRSYLVPTKNGVRGILIRESKGVKGKDSFELGGVEPWEVSDMLREMGVPNNSIAFLADFSGGSKSVLRRRLSANPAIFTPDWGNDIGFLNDLIPLICLNRWNIRNPYESKTMGNLSQDDYKSVLVKYISKSNYPVKNKDGVYEIVSLSEVLFYFTKNSSSCKLDDLLRFLKGVILNAGYEIKKSAYNALIILDVYRSNCDLSGRYLIDQTIRDIAEEKFNLQNANLGVVWNELPLLAELFPSRCLCFIESALNDGEETLFENDNFRKLLRAIELLAFNRDYFSKCVQCAVLLLRRISSEKNVDAVKSMLKTFFCFWLPQTKASPEDRNRELEKLFACVPDIAWEVALEQIDPYFKIGHRNQPAIWREKDQWQYVEKPTLKDVNLVRAFAFDKVLEYLTLQRKEILSLLNYTFLYDKPLQQRVWGRLGELASYADAFCCAEMQKHIRKFIYRAKLKARRTPCEVYENLQLAQNTLELYQPNDVFWENAWLFQYDWMDCLPYKSEDDEDFDRLSTDITELRREKIRVLNIKSSSDVLSIIKLEKLDAFNVAKLLCEEVGGGELVLDALKKLLTDEACGEFECLFRVVSGFLSGMSVGDRRQIVLYAKENLNDDRCDFLFSCLPCNKETWSLIAAMGAELEDRFWLKVTIYVGDIEDDSDRVILERLLRNGRHLWILKHIRFITDPQYLNIRRQLFSLVYRDRIKNWYVFGYQDKDSISVLIKSIMSVLSDVEIIKVGLRFFDLIRSTEFNDVFFSLATKKAKLFFRLYERYWYFKYAIRNCVENTITGTSFFYYLVKKNYLKCWLSEINEYVLADGAKYLMSDVGEFLARAFLQSRTDEFVNCDICQFFNENRHVDLQTGFKKGVYSLLREKYNYSFPEEWVFNDIEKIKKMSQQLKEEYPNFAALLNDTSIFLIDLTD